MTLQQLIELADKGYPDHQVLAHWDARAGYPYGGLGGDTLALYVVRDLYATFEPDRSNEEQLTVACEAIRQAIGNLNDVLTVLESEMRRTPGGEGE